MCAVEILERCCESLQCVEKLNDLAERPRAHLLRAVAKSAENEVNEVPCLLTITRRDATLDQAITYIPMLDQLHRLVPYPNIVTKRSWEC